MPPLEVTIPSIIAVLTVLVGIIVKVLGFPAQFRLNHRRKSTEGLSTLFVVLTFTSYVLWTLHGTFQGDWVVIIGQGVGIFVSAAILFQVFLYRGGRDNNTK